MFDWLFKKKETQIVLGSASIEYWSISDKANKKQEKPNEPDISEPVYKMVEVVKRSPLRLCISHHGFSACHGSIIDKWVIKDKKTNEEFVYEQIDYGYPLGGKIRINHKIKFTDDEVQYLINQLKPIFQARFDRANRIKKLRNDRLQREARERLFNLLGDGE